VVWFDIFEPSANLIRVASQGANPGRLASTFGGQFPIHTPQSSISLSKTRNPSTTATKMSGLLIRNIDIVRIVVHS